MKRQADKMQKEAAKMQKEAVQAAAAASKSMGEAMGAANDAMPIPSPVVMPQAAGTDIPVAAPTVQTEQDMEEAMAQAAKENEAAKQAFAEAAKANALPVKREQEPEFVVWGEGGADEADAKALQSGFAL